MNPERLDDTQLQRLADDIRLASIRAIASYGNGHVGGIFSMAELLAVLYGRFVRTDLKNPRNLDRDKVVLSKGHCGPGIHAALAVRGLYSQDEIGTVNQNGTCFPSHCDMRKTLGVDMTTGSLGQGASTAAGLALADKIAGRDFNTYVIMGDGELGEGQVWEMALFAAQHRLDNLVACVDANGQQLDGDVKDILDLGDIAAKFVAFGWNAIDVPDGHDAGLVAAAVDAARSHKGRPSVVVLKTVKGKGWAELEKKSPAHHSVVTPEVLAEVEREILAHKDGI